MKPIVYGVVFKRTSAFVITAVILTILLYAGPANAFILGLSVADDSSSEVEKDQDIKFIATITIESMDQYLPIKELKLNLDGPVKKSCTFDISGKTKTSCNGITIKNIEVAEYYGYGYGQANQNGYGYSFGNNYGYGYNYGAGGKQVEFRYEITLDTSYYLAGEYNTQLQAKIGTKTFSENGEIITINSAEEENITTTGYSGDNQKIESGKLKINMNSTGNGNIAVVEFTSNPKKGFAIPSIGKFFEIDADQEILENMQTTKLEVEYDEDEIIAKGIDEATLRLYYYNENKEEWEMIDAPNGGVDTVNNIVWAFTDHFSVWGIFGSEQTTSIGGGGQKTSSRGSACFTQWTCTEWSECENNQQTRTCSKEIESCFAQGMKPAETQECSSQQGFFSRITGAVIGALGTSGSIAVVIFLIVVIGGTVIIVYVNKRK